MNHPANYLRHNRPVEMSKSKGKASSRVPTLKVPKGSVLEGARQYLKDQGLTFVDGERVK